MNEATSGMPADAVHAPYVALQALSSPAVCGQCGAVHADGQWQWSPAPPGAATTTCPACLRMGDRQPAGELTIDAPLSRAHRETIVALAARWRRARSCRRRTDHHDHRSSPGARLGRGAARSLPGPRHLYLRQERAHAAGGGEALSA